MLVLSRKQDESIEANGPCRFTILGIREGRVVVGIEADSKVSIMRSELLDRTRVARREGR